MGQVEDNKLEFAVISARHAGKWIFVRHKERTTWEITGGHREFGEDINDTASRELVEETGAEEFKLYPICVYSVDNEGSETCGQLYYAEVSTLGDLPASEIEEIRLYDEIPDNLTHALIQPYLFEKSLNFLKSSM